MTALSPLAPKYITLSKPTNVWRPGYNYVLVNIAVYSQMDYNSD